MKTEAKPVQAGYQQSLNVPAPAEVLYAALTTSAGVRGWWTRDCEVANHVGGLIDLRFGPNRKQMRIEALEPGREVRWLCTAAHIDALNRKDEWVGTRLAFRLTPVDAQCTRLDFEHAGLMPELECYGLCTRGWRYFLESLRGFAVTGAGTPYEQQTECAH
jgi:uncharacterized protein YndB with AHSA1/START domain